MRLDSLGRRISTKSDAWTEAEDAVLHAHYIAGGWMGVKDMLPRRKERAVYLRASALGLRSQCRKKPNEWSEQEDALMRQHYPVGGLRAVAPFLPGRSSKAVHMRARFLEVRSHLGPGQWTDSEDAVLREHYTAQGAAYVGERIGRTVLSVRHRAGVLGVKADKARAGRCRVAAVKARKQAAGELIVAAPSKKAKPKPAPVQWANQQADTSKAKKTIAPPFVDRRFTATGPVQRVVDSRECRAWAAMAVA